MKKLTACTADRHWLYENSVQDVAWECDFLLRRYQWLRRQPPHILREDFCGTAALACQWVRTGINRTAIGIDLDREVLAWGQEHNRTPLGTRADHVHLLQQDVMLVREPADIVAACNFSYFIFTDRALLRQYFAGVHDSLRPKGMFALDVFGGSDASVVQEEPRQCQGFTYVWDQHAYDPITGRIDCRIHFRFRDGSELRDAFHYDWRLWTIPELRELLLEAGFASVDVYWQCTDHKTGEYNGVYRRAANAENSPGWLAYIIAGK